MLQKRLDVLQWEVLCPGHVLQWDELLYLRREVR
jgi:hypothetical protein